MQMREAVGYLAALASKSELDKIAHKLLGVHLELGVKIESLIEQRKDERSNRGVKSPSKTRSVRH